MSEWPTARLDDCAKIVSGATPSTSKSAYWNGDIYWATPMDLSELEGAYISATPRMITRAGLESCAATVLPPESVLFSSRAPIGHVAINTVPMATNQGFKSFVPSRDRLHAKFLYHWLRTNRPYLEGLGNGATFKEVSKAVVSRIEIPLPPLAEQRRIAEILDKADALKAKRRAALAQLDTLTQSIFLDMFGDPATNSKGWPVVSLPDVIYFQEGPGVRNWQFQNQGIKLINVKNIVDGMLVPENTNRYLSSEDVKKRYEHFLLDAGDLVVASSGVTWGKIAEVQHEHLPLCLNTSMIRLRPLTDRIRPRFIRTFVESSAFRNQITRLITGSAQPNFGPAHLKQVILALPPLHLQLEYDRRISAAETLRLAQRAALAELVLLFASLQHRAFRGELSTSVVKSFEAAQ
jgi:type I restriction enzyme S subunit